MYFVLVCDYVSCAGMIMGVKSNGIRVMVPKFGFESTIKLVSKDMESGREPNPWKFDEEKMTITSDKISYK